MFAALDRGNPTHKATSRWYKLTLTLKDVPHLVLCSHLLQTHVRLHELNSLAHTEPFYFKVQSWWSGPSQKSLVIASPAIKAHPKNHSPLIVYLPRVGLSKRSSGSPGVAEPTSTLFQSPSTITRWHCARAHDKADESNEYICIGITRVR